MIPPLAGVGRKIRIGDGYPVTMTEAMQQACNYITHSRILNDKHPGEGFDERMRNSMAVLRDGLRAQIPQWEAHHLDKEYGDNPYGEERLKFLANWLGSWDYRTGKSKNGWAEPVRSIMDIPLVSECKAHGLMHDCPEAK